MEVAPPGTVVEATGAAVRRMKMANLITSLDVPRFVALKCVMSSGVALMRQFAGRPVVVSSPGSGRSCVNASLLTPCSTLYASPAKITSDLFCAFQPKRLIVPSLPLWLKVPLVPNVPAFAAALFSKVESSMFSINPRPKVGVGMRKITLPVATAWAKLGCVILQAPASTRPVMVYRSSTPPFGLFTSGLPAALKKNGKRASRTGPVAVMNDGTVLRAPSNVAWATCGLVAGLVPPTAGAAWQAAQLLELKRGPRPEPSSPATVPETESTSAKVSSASLKKARLPAGLFAATEASGPPAPAAPPRTPGSV